ncbi:MAG: hypothetical protein ACREBS_07205, partial [Nitrososphaerales archaeon]
MPDQKNNRALFSKNGETAYRILSTNTVSMQYGELMSAEEESQIQAMRIHSALANKDSFRIFGLAARGIDASRDVLARHDFSKKRYYVRLKELVDLGLVAKDEGVYRHTALGSIIYENQVSSLQRILEKRGSLEVLNDLRTKNRSDEKLRSEISDLSRQVMRDLETSIGLSNLKPIRLLRTGNEFSTHVASIVDAMSSE